MEGLILFAQDYHSFIVGIHLFGVVLGFGAVLISDILFLKFLKDVVMKYNELEVLRTMSKIIWVGLAILVASGAFLFISDIEKYSQSAKFLTKMIVVGVIIVNGTMLNFVVTPRLASIPFKELITSQDKKIKNARRLTFALGAISATSWWAAFILGLIRGSAWSLPLLLGIYLAILCGGILISQLFERFISTRKITAI